MAASQIATVGYQGRAQHDFLSLLDRAGVDLLVDVRIRAQSRKPGFSRSTLSAGLAEAGMRYEHMRDLGTPLGIRALFRGGDIGEARELYRAYLLEEARASLDELARRAGEQQVCIMCYEFDERECHRLVVAEQLERLHGIGAIHLRT